MKRMVGRGSVKNNGYRRIVVAFDEESFAEVRAKAIRDKTSFAEAIRTLVVWGFEAEKELT